MSAVFITLRDPVNEEVHMIILRDPDCLGYVHVYTLLRAIRRPQAPSQLSITNHPKHMHMLLLSGSELLSLPAASSASALPNRAGTPLRMMAIAGVERRRVPVSLGGDPPLTLHVDEVADWSWWDRESEAPGSNPYGAKLWPAALAIAEHLAALPASALQDLSVLELGCGSGLCSMAAAARGASRVVASDLSADVQLTREAVARQKLSVDTLQLDLGDRSTPLPPDLVLQPSSTTH